MQRKHPSLWPADFKGEQDARIFGAESPRVRTSLYGKCDTDHAGYAYVRRFTPAQVYEVVADVNLYKSFLPWCQESTVVRRDGLKTMAHLTVGFPPLTESYTAMVLMEPPWSMRVSGNDT